MAVPIPAIMRGRIIRRFEKYGAIGLDNAKTLSDMDMESFPFNMPIGKRIFIVMQKRGIIQNAGDKYYLINTYLRTTVHVLTAVLFISALAAAIAGINIFVRGFDTGITVIFCGLIIIFAALLITYLSVKKKYKLLNNFTH